MGRLSRQARRRGLRVVGVDTAANLAGADRTLLDELVVADVHDATVAGELAKRLPGEVDALLTFRELAVEPAAVLAEALGLPGITAATAHTLRHKDLCRGVLRSAAFVQPEVLVTDDRDEAAEFITSTGSGPWIVKPRDGMGSAGIDLVVDVASLDAALTARPRAAPFLVETFVIGREMSVEGFVVGGRAVPLCLTEKRVGPWFVEIGHRIPAPMEVADIERVEEQVTRAARVLGLTHGLFHIELWLTRDGLVFGEFHARPGGDFLPAMVEYVRPGLELYGTVLDDLLGAEPPPVPALSRSAGVDFLIVGSRGRVGAVTGWRQAAGDPCVLAAHPLVASGDILTPVRDSADRHGVVVVGADTMTAVETSLARARDLVQIAVDAGDGGLPMIQHERRGAAT
jgi:hypothetical protein